jgi:predicted kinase
LSEQARLVATGGHAVILDATFLDPVPRRQIEAELRAWFKPGLHVGPD